MPLLLALAHSFMFQDHLFGDLRIVLCHYKYRLSSSALSYNLEAFHKRL